MGGAGGMSAFAWLAELKLTLRRELA